MTTTTTTRPNASPRLLRTKDAADYIGITPAGLRDWINRGLGPKVTRISPGHRARTFFHIDDLDEWIAEARTPTATSGGR